MHTADAHLEVRVPVKAGLHEVGVSFVRRFWEPEGVLQPPQTGFGRTTNEYYHGNPAVEIVFDRRSVRSAGARATRSAAARCSRACRERRRGSSARRRV